MEDADEDERAGALAWVRAAYPGAFRPGVAAAAAAGLLVALALAALALWVRGTQARLALGSAALIAWGQGAAWLVEGDLARLDEVLGGLSGARWLVLLAAWWLPVWAAWVVATP